MCTSCASFILLALLLHSVLALVSAQGSKSNTTALWQTLSGDPPFVVARGGFSGLFPDSSLIAYNFALVVSVPDLILWCDVQLTKDGAGICLPDLKMDNSTNIGNVFNKEEKMYLVNGVPTKGWFSVDYTLKQLGSVFLNQGVYSRANNFDGSSFPILTVQDVAALKPPGLWLNFQHDAFYTQHNLSMRSFVLSVSRSVIVSYVSSPEVAFLRSVEARFRPSTTKLVFRFLGQDALEPTTNQTYGSLLKNLTFIKTFASGILVPKSYIWPVDSSYLLPHTSLVPDAHKLGFEVFASEFYNDVPLSYNYSYDPVSEYLGYIDNGEFSVDGVLSDFPITPSEAIDCFAHLSKNDKPQATPLVISKCGASGDYPGCTDLAYGKAILDGVDVLDCPVQMAQDGIPFCLSSINLINSTTVVQTTFNNLTKEIPAINTGTGIFAFDLTWPQIQSLTPAIANPFSGFTLYRNPKFKNSGTFLTLSDFLSLAKNTSSLSGVLIKIEHVAYLAEEQDLSVIDAVLSVLSKSGYDNQTTQKVMIQSTNSSVLTKFKGKSNYHLVYEVDETIRDALNSTILDIKSFASAVVVGKSSVFSLRSAFLTRLTDVVSKFQSFKLPVYVETFSNEFVSQAWDFLSDATVEINSYVAGANIDGVITDYPKTAARYRKNRCLNLGNNTPSYMSPVQPGGLLSLIEGPYLPPAEAPIPALTDLDVAEAPLPPLSGKSPTNSTDGVSTAPTSTPTNGQPKITTWFFLSNLAMLLSALFLLS